MTKPTVTAVGPRLKPNGDQPQILHRITVSPAGVVKTITRQALG